MLDVVILVLAWGVAIALVCFGLAAIVRAWRSGTTDRNINAMLRDARDRAYWRGRQGG